MPRRTGVTSSFWIEPDATNQDVIDALEEIAGNKTLADVVDSTEESNQELKSIHLGQELHVWEEEVEA